MKTENKIKKKKPFFISKITMARLYKAQSSEHLYALFEDEWGEWVIFSNTK